MKKLIRGMTALMALVVIGCADDTPTEAARGEHDDAVAKIVAGALGYESNGLAAMVADMVTAGTGGTLRSEGSAMHEALTVTQNDSIFDPASLTQSLVLGCERNHADAYSEWKLRYTIDYAEMEGRGDMRKPGTPVAGRTHADGTYRNSILTVQGKSDGTIGFVKPDAGRSAWLNGEYRWQGTTSFRDEAASYGNVVVTFTWNRLHVKCRPGGSDPILTGRCDVTIRANGPEGAVSRNGSITFDGGEQALLTVGGKRYLVSVRSPELVREA